MALFYLLHNVLKYCTDAVPEHKVGIIIKIGGGFIYDNDIFSSEISDKIAPYVLRF